MPDQSETNRLSKYSQRSGISIPFYRQRVFIIGIFVLILGALSIYFGIQFRNTLDNAWSDPNTWQIEGLQLPKYEERYRIYRTSQEDTITIKIDYCGLYRVEIPVEGQGNDVKYYCAFIPLAYLNAPTLLDRLNHTLDGNDITQDSLVFNINTKEGLLPEDYIGKNPQSVTQYLSDVQNPIPVQPEFTFEVTYPAKNFFSMFSHYNQTGSNKKETIPSNLTKWAIKQIPSGVTLSDDEKVTIYKEWADNLWKEINGLVDKKSVYSNASFEKLLEVLGMETEKCQIKENTPDCELTSENMNNTNLIHYLYTTAYRDPEHFDALSKYIYEHYFPFIALNTNPDLASNDLKSDQFPICPIAEITNGIKNERVFGFMKKYFGNHNIISYFRSSKSATLTQIININDELVMKERINFLFGSALDIDRNCNFFVTSGQGLTTFSYTNLQGYGNDNSVKQYENGLYALMRRRYLPIMNSASSLEKLDVDSYFIVPASKKSYLSNAVFSAFIERIYAQPYKTYALQYKQDSAITSFDVQSSLMVLYDITAITHE